MNVFKSLKAFFTSRKPDPVAVISRNLFCAASTDFDAAFDTAEPWTKRANHRHIIFLASRSIENAETYRDEIARYTDPADFKPYTEAELDAHTAAIDRLAAVFDRLTVAFDALNSTDELYKPAGGVYKALTALYVMATNAYYFASERAKMNALNGSTQAAKEALEITIAEISAGGDYPTENALAAKAKAVASKPTNAQNAAAAKHLEQKATEAEARAEALCACASSATARAEEFSEEIE